MKGKFGLGEVEIPRQIADASFSKRQSMNHLEADGIGKRFEHLPGLLGIEGVLHHKSSVP